MIGPEKSPGNPEDIVRHIYNSRVRLQHIFQGSWNMKTQGMHCYEGHVINYMKPTKTMHLEIPQN